MRHNLSCEELFDDDSSCDDTINELIGDLSAEDNSQDSPIATGTAFTSTSIKQEPLDPSFL